MNHLQETKSTPAEGEKPLLQPISNCTVKELASMIDALESGTELNFCLNPDGSDYWGVRVVQLFDSVVTLFGRYGEQFVEVYNDAEELTDLTDKLVYHLEKEQYETVYLFQPQKDMTVEEMQENIVTSYFYYMWNAFSQTESDQIFGYLSQHMTDKWNSICKRHSVYSAAERLYADLTQDNRLKLVTRACLQYNGNSKRK